MGKIELHFFHGFLGQPEDWDSVTQDLSKEESFEIYQHDLWSFFDEEKSVGFESLPNLINQKVSESENIKIGIGYSLGGRILMHCDPELFSHYILIAAHPGLLTQEDKDARILNDSKWSDRFLSMDWDHLMSLWNNQEIFHNDHKRPVRKEGFFVRQSLAKCLNALSLGKQDLRDSFLNSVRGKIFWACGAKDHKFLSLKGRIEALVGKENIYIIDNSGHGCLFDQPQKITEIIKGIIR